MDVGGSGAATLRPLRYDLVRKYSRAADEAGVAEGHLGEDENTDEAFAGRISLSSRKN